MRKTSNIVQRYSTINEDKRPKYRQSSPSKIKSFGHKFKLTRQEVNKMRTRMNKSRCAHESRSRSRERFKETSLKVEPYEIKLLTKLRDTILDSAHMHEVDKQGKFLTKPHQPSKAWLQRKTSLNTAWIDNVPSHQAAQSSKNNYCGSQLYDDKPKSILAGGNTSRNNFLEKKVNWKDNNEYIDHLCRKPEEVNRFANDVSNGLKAVTSILDCFLRKENSIWPLSTYSSLLSDDSYDPRRPVQQEGKFHTGVPPNVMRHRRPWLEHHLKKEELKMKQTKIEMEEYINHLRQSQKKK